MEKKRIYIEKTVENMAAYDLSTSINALWNAYITEGVLSDKTISLYEAFIDSLYDDVGHLKCDDLQSSYIIECGWNYTE